MTLTASEASRAAALARLSPEALRAVEEALAVDVGRWVPYVPTAKQTAAFLLEGVLEVGYGGAAGGAKSWWLLGEALRHVDRPGYSAILFRQTLPDLNQEPNGLIPTLRRWLEPMAGTPGLRWAAQQRTWHFPSGATVTFGYLLDQEGERYRRYAGPSWHMIGVDQAEQFRPDHYRFLFSRLRQEIGVPWPLRFRSTFNPGGPSHDFLVERFNLLGAYPDPMVCQGPPDVPCGLPSAGHPEAHPFTNRAFMPSFLDDNPHLDRRSYEAALLALGEVEYQRLRFGNFAITTSGVFFKTERFLASEAPPPGALFVRAWDQAATEEGEGHDPDYTVGLLLARSGFQEWIVDVVRGRWSPDGVDQQIQETADRDGAHVPIVVEQEGRSAGRREIAYLRRSLPGHRVIGRVPSGDKIKRATQAARWVNGGLDPLTRTPLAVALCPGPWVPAFTAELRSFKGDGRLHDDQVDAFAIAHNWLDENSRGWQPQAESLEELARLVAPRASSDYPS